MSMLALEYLDGIGLRVATASLRLPSRPRRQPRLAAVLRQVDSFDGLGGGFRSRRRRTAAERAAIFFLAVLVTPLLRGLCACALLFCTPSSSSLSSPTLTSAKSLCTLDADAACLVAATL